MPDLALSHIRIVLVEPAGALNVGSVARVMKNMGLQQLVLVNPHCDPGGEEARRMAVHGGDVLVAAKRVATLPQALQGCQRAIATTGRIEQSLVGHGAIDPIESPRSALPWLLSSSDSAPFASALIFGPEDRGLSNTELNYAQRFVRIPTSPVYPSLNLAQAAAICCYELHVAAGEAILPVQLEGRSDRLSNRSEDAQLAPLEALEGYYQHLEAVLLKIGYLYPHTAASRMEKFRRLLNRAYPSGAEVALLRGILSQVEWLQRRAEAATVSQIWDASSSEQGQSKEIDR